MIVAVVFHQNSRTVLQECHVPAAARSWQQHLAAGPRTVYDLTQNGGEFRLGQVAFNDNQSRVLRSW
jgi:hypothetical protein